MSLFVLYYHPRFTDGELRLSERKQPKVTEHVSGKARIQTQVHETPETTLNHHTRLLMKGKHCSQVQ